MAAPASPSSAAAHAPAPRARPIRRRGRRLGFRFSRGGWVYLSSLLLLIAAAMNTGNNLLFLLAASMLAALLVSGFVSSLVLSNISLHFRLPIQVFAGRDIPVRLELENEKRFMPSFALTVQSAGALARRRPPRREQGELEMPPAYFPYLPARRRVGVIVSIHFPRRGLYDVAGLSLSTSFPFGLIRKWRRFHAEALDQPILAYPEIESGRAGAVAWLALEGRQEQHVPGPGHDLYRIRQHLPGDSARQVHWKASAKTGELRVREFSREQQMRTRIVFAADSARLTPARQEKLISDCAALLWEAARRGAAIEFMGCNLTLPLPAGSRFPFFPTALAAPGGEPPHPLQLPLAAGKLHLDTALTYLALVDFNHPPLPPSGSSGQAADQEIVFRD